MGSSGQSGLNQRKRKPIYVVTRCKGQWRMARMMLTYIDLYWPIDLDIYCATARINRDPARATETTRKEWWGYKENERWTRVVRAEKPGSSRRWEPSSWTTSRARLDRTCLIWVDSFIYIDSLNETRSLFSWMLYCLPMCISWMHHI